MLEKLDWWIKCLEDEGIYVWLDLQVGRQFKFADEIDGFSEISKGKPTADLRGYNYVNTSIERAMQRFNEAYLNHRNTFNGLAYKDDPGIVALLLTNENDVTHHFGNALLPDKQVPQHNALYMAQAEAFAAKFGLREGQDVALMGAWAVEAVPERPRAPIRCRDDPAVTEDRSQSTHRHDE